MKKLVILACLMLTASVAKATVIPEEENEEFENYDEIALDDISRVVERISRRWPVLKESLIDSLNYSLNYDTFKYDPVSNTLEYEKLPDEIDKEVANYRVGRRIKVENDNSNSLNVLQRRIKQINNKWKVFISRFLEKNPDFAGNRKKSKPPKGKGKRKSTQQQEKTEENEALYIQN